MGELQLHDISPEVFLDQNKGKSTMLLHSVITIILGRIFSFYFYFNWRERYFLLSYFTGRKLRFRKVPAQDHTKPQNSKARIQRWGCVTLESSI